MNASPMFSRANVAVSGCSEGGAGASSSGSGNGWSQDTSPAGGRLPRLSAQEIQAGVGGDPVQPGPQGGPPREGLPPAPGAQERLLHQVLRFLERPQHPVAVHPQLLAVALGRGAERHFIVPRKAARVAAPSSVACVSVIMRNMTDRGRETHRSGEIFLRRAYSSAMRTARSPGLVVVALAGVLLLPARAAADPAPEGGGGISYFDVHRTLGTVALGAFATSLVIGSASGNLGKLMDPQLLPRRRRPPGVLAHHRSGAGDHRHRRLLGRRRAGQLQPAVPQSAQRRQPAGHAPGPPLAGAGPRGGLRHLGGHRPDHVHARSRPTPTASPRRRASTPPRTCCWCRC